MNIEAWISSNVCNGKDATISMALLEHLFGEPFAEKRISLWADDFAKKLGVKATIHIASNVVTFYPKEKA